MGKVTTVKQYGGLYSMKLCKVNFIALFLNKKKRFYKNKFSWNKTCVTLLLKTSNRRFIRAVCVNLRQDFGGFSIPFIQSETGPSTHEYCEHFHTYFGTTSCPPSLFQTPIFTYSGNMQLLSFGALFEQFMWFLVTQQKKSNHRRRSLSKKASS